jgi:hypothetical protein
LSPKGFQALGAAVAEKLHRLAQILGRDGTAIRPA